MVSSTKTRHYSWPLANLLLLFLTQVAYSRPLAVPKTARTPRNIILFVADGLRRGSVNAQDAPTFLLVRQQGVDFANSHSLFPTFTTPNASAIAAGHYLADTGDFANSEFIGFPVFSDGRVKDKRAGSPLPFLENDSVLADVNAHFEPNGYLNEETFLSLANHHGYNTAAVGKLGPAAIQDVTQLNPVDGDIPAGRSIIIDDATGSSAGIPLSPAVQAAFNAAGVPLAAPPRDQPAGNVDKPGTLLANVAQQQYFLEATLKAVLPLFKANRRPFALIYWSRDPDGSQHNQGDSLNHLQPGINGPTSRAGVHNADQNLKALLDYISADASLAANTDVFVTSDHGFATISKHEIDTQGEVSKSYSTSFHYRSTNQETKTPEVTPGWLPPGFLSIDLAHALALPLYDPDSQVMVNGKPQYEVVDPSKPNSASSRQRPAMGSGLIGGSGVVLGAIDAKVIVAANGGSDLIYVPSQDGALVRKLIQWLATQDYVGGIFADSSFGHIPGALSLATVGLEGAAVTPRPSIIVAFKTFASDPQNPLQSAVQIADTTLQEGQGMHGSFGRDNTYNNMAAIGPDFKKGFVDVAPVSNADIASTLAYLLQLPVSSHGHFAGRVLEEALAGGPDRVPFQHHQIGSSKTASPPRATFLEYQSTAGRSYYDRACFAEPASRDVSEVQAGHAPASCSR